MDDKGSRKKNIFFRGPATKRGGGGKVWATKNKELFLKLERKKITFMRLP